MSGSLTSPVPPVPAPSGSQLADFRQRCAPLTDVDLTAPEALHHWSVTEYRQFWRTFLDWAGLALEGSPEVVCTSDDVERAAFFPDVRLSYVENVLRPLEAVDDTAVALTAVHGNGTVDHLSRAQLRARVRATATTLAGHGIGAGDRVVVITPSNARAAVTVLSLAALGAAVSTGMPDMGPIALLGRFRQVDPVVLVLDRTGSAGWTAQDGDTLSSLLTELPALRRVLVLDDAPLPGTTEVPVARLGTDTEDSGDDPTPWPRLPFDHPLFLMFSSGTTGAPKAMVHGAGGTLLEHLKEHRLHGDLRPDDTLYFHTTTAWMMWNWQLSALAVGARVVLYDGPVRGPETLWRLAAEQRVTVFGTSPAYLQLCQDAGWRPRDEVDLSRLRSVLSTGAVLHDWQFDWVADAIGPLPLQSISGGTDILGCFVLGHPELPVRRGRCQSRSLGLDVAAVDEDGAEVTGAVGELVCRNPFPSRPVGFLQDPDGRRFHDAYFADHPGMWTHGDLIEIEVDGSARLHGRSDGVLNIDGVRIGPSEIYTIVRSIPEVADVMAVEQRDPAAMGATRLVLLVVLHPGRELDHELTSRIRGTLRRQGSAAHVPSLVLPVADLPVTHNGKRSERAARDVLNGDPVANLAALRNPESLDDIAMALTDRDRTVRSAPLVVDTHDATAAAVARLWRDALGPGTEGAGTFADLGGTSRQAMTLVRQVRLTLGRDVDLETFLAAPTLDGLTAAARAARHTGDAPPVIRLAAGDPALPPVIFVHDAWGDLDVYWPAAQLLTGAGPVQGVRTDLHRADGSRRSIPELAEIEAEEIQRAVPAGPVRLIGHSFGGLMAYEIAGRLADAGREVDFVGLLDSLPPRAVMTPLERAVSLQAVRLAAVLPGLRAQPLGTVLHGHFRPTALPEDGRTFRESGAVYGDHVLRRYDGPVTYFRARRRIPAAQNMLRAWRRVAPRLGVVDIPGAHHDLLGEANVAGTAAAISRALARASCSSSTEPADTRRGT